jgi:hypothetical protein
MWNEIRSIHPILHRVDRLVDSRPLVTYPFLGYRMLELESSLFFEGDTDYMRRIG